MSRFKLGFLLATILTFILSVAFGLLLVVVINQYKGSLKDYDDYTKRAYTFEHSERIREYRGRLIYKVYVKEEELPLMVLNISSKAVNNKTLNALKKGDRIITYINLNKSGDDYSYEVVEIKAGDNMILSLSDHQRREKNNSLIGFVIVPIMALSALGFSTYFLIKFIKE